MAGPPRDVEPSELFAKLTEVPRPSEVVDFPRYDKNGEPAGRVRIQVLSQRDHDTARKRALDRLKTDKKMSNEELATALGESLSGDASAKELLAMACLTDKPARGTEDNPVYGRIFRDAKDVEALTSDEVAALFNHYLNIQYKFGPFERTVTTDAELTQWILRLKEGASSSPLVQLSLPALADLALMTAQRAHLLSSALESQWSSLPDTLKSDLANCSLGTGLFGAPALNTAADDDCVSG